MRQNLFYVTDARWGGSSSLSIIARRYISGLTRKGWKIQVIAPSPEPGIKKEGNIMKIPLLRESGLLGVLHRNLKKSFSPLSTGWQWTSSAWAPLIEEAKQQNPAGIIAQGFASSYLAYQCFQLLRIPYVIDQRDAWTINPYLQAFPRGKRWKKQFKNWLGRGLEREILKNARFIFFLAEQLREVYLRTFHLPAERTGILYNAWDPDERIDHEVKEKHGTLRFLFGGSLPPNCWKNLQNFLLTLQSLQQIHRETQLSFYLSGWAVEAKRFIQTLPLSFPISFSQNLTLAEYHQKVAEADICLTFRSLSPYDYGCNRVFSYMLYRKPTLVIAHPLSTEAQLVIATGLGWVVHPGDLEEMKRILLEIFEKWHKKENLITPKEEKIWELSLPVQVEKLSAILESVFLSH